MRNQTLFPFTAITGQSDLKRAIEIMIVNPKAGGLLIGGEKGTAKSTLVRGIKELVGNQKIIELPLNATEDMLFGSIDLEYAIAKGAKKFLPGILSKAGGNILYIDEINLLRQDLLTAVLDINAAGINNVERDGISFSHAVNFWAPAACRPVSLRPCRRKEYTFFRTDFGRLGKTLRNGNGKSISRCTR